ncbi:MAG: glycoside hydrolase family 13 protein [Peptococcia bacterium]
MTDWFVFDSHQEIYKKPFGAAACGQTVNFTVAVKENCGLEQVELVIADGKQYQEYLRLEPGELQGGRRYWGINYLVPKEPGLLWYFFQIRKDGRNYFYGNNSRAKGGLGLLTEELPQAYQLTVYKEGNSVVGNWFIDGVVYHIFVDRFYNGNENGLVSNPKKGSLLHGQWNDTPVYLRDKEGRIARWDFFGGNLAGVRKKLPYLRDLGVTTIYLSPIFLAPSNHKYDTADYLRIDPMFGDIEDFRELCRDAAQIGIYIILDGVFSHTGSDSVYFNKEGNYPEKGAYQSPDSPYYSWYRFSNYPHQYECWWGIDTMPNVNEMEPSYRDFILHNENSVIRYWMKEGARGWRLDVADELPAQFLRELYATVKEMDGEAVVIGEVWEDASNKVSYGEQRYYFAGDQLDGVTNYPFRRALLDFMLGQTGVLDLHYELMSLAENYPAANLAASLNILGSHDVPRVLTLLGLGNYIPQLTEEEWEHFRLSPEQRSLAKARLKLLSLFQFTSPGVPCIYYGDEVGLEGYRDPYNRGTYPWGQEDQELLEWYKEISHLRRERPILRQGDWYSLGLELVEDNPGSRVFAFRRRLTGQVAIALFNPDEARNYMIKIRQETVGAEVLKEICLGQERSGQERAVSSGQEFQLTLKPLQGRILIGELLPESGN